MKEKIQIILKGIFKENPIFVLVLGMCPTLATTSSAINGLSMGLATSFVLMLSNLTISLVGKMIPDKVRIPSYIVIIAAFVTVVDLLMAGYLPGIHSALGIFIPLIVVNCIVLARAESFAAKNGTADSIFDGNGERRLMEGGIFADHHVQTEFFAARFGQGSAEHTASVSNHEIHRFGRDFLRSDNKIALVFAVFVIDHYYDFALPDIVQSLVYRIKIYIFH